MSASVTAKSTPNKFVVTMVALVALLLICAGGFYAIESDLHLAHTINMHTAGRIIHVNNTRREPLRDYQCPLHFDGGKNSTVDLTLRANCGLDYPLPTLLDPTARAPIWRVVFFGEAFRNAHMREMLACPKTCPLSPHCRLVFSTNPAAVRDANVVIVDQTNYVLLPNVLAASAGQRENETALVGIYWREAHKTFVPLRMQALADFEMGVHLHAKVVSPVLFHAPYLLQQQHEQHNAEDFAQRKFALYVASNCVTSSQRSVYLDRIEAELQQKQQRMLVVDRFGKCFNRSLPGKSLLELTNGIPLNKYKFFFAFENTIQNGYTTEKLFTALGSDVLPVYYGALDAPNVTLAPSYIRASDFRTPELLAQYLIYLDENPSKYHDYFAWKRQGAGAFDPEYLGMVARNWVSNRELEPIRRVKAYLADRAASCCRLCNREFMRAGPPRTSRRYVSQPLVWEEIHKIFCDGQP